MVCEEKDRKVTISQSVGGKQQDRTFRFDMVRQEAYPLCLYAMACTRRPTSITYMCSDSATSSNQTSAHAASDVLLNTLVITSAT